MMKLMIKLRWLELVTIEGIEENLGGKAPTIIIWVVLK
uniref:Uncharacterized protein n=1 Tax=Rhizophora mucronata TaxID=61149 RepID=A0A2P2KAA6_RHIMU